MAATKMINETVPVFMLGRVGVVVQTSMAFGYFIVIGMGAGLPSADYDPAIRSISNDEAKVIDMHDTFWRIIYVIPCLINIWMLFSMTFFIQEDSIMFNLSKDDDESAMRLIEKVYHPSENRQEILKTLKGQVAKKPGKNIPYNEAVFGEKYIKATFIGCAITFFY